MNEYSNIKAICPLSGKNCTLDRCPLWMHFSTMCDCEDDVINQYEQCALIPIAKGLVKQFRPEEPIDESNDKNKRFIENDECISTGEIEVPY